MKALIASTSLAFLTIFAPAQEPTDKSMEAAGELIEIMNLREEMSNAFKAFMEPVLKPMIEQMGLNPAQVIELNNVFESWWENDIDQEAIVKEYKMLYASTYTMEELQELSLFYQTPLGKKMLLTMSDLTRKGAEIGMNAAQGKEGILAAKIEAFQEQVEKEAATEEKDAE